MNELIQERIEKIGKAKSPRLREEDYLTCIPLIASKKMDINETEVRALISLVSNLFRTECLNLGFQKKSITALTTKFRDAGRRSAPWKQTSSRVPGRPQDGADGNRILRWKLPSDHKFYASEIIATLVEVKYYLQALSMKDAPDFSKYNLQNLFTPWLLEHQVKPEEYYDPVQLIPISFIDFLDNPKSIQSGHIFPLDRGGVHHPNNAFLMLSRSNQLQGNLTVQELLELMRKIVKRHDEAYLTKSPLETKIRES